MVVSTAVKRFVSVTAGFRAHTAGREAGGDSETPDLRVNEAGRDG